MSEKLYSDNFAYDLSNKILTKGEIFDYDVINQSIENILSTVFGERLFNPFYGSTLSNQLFEAMDSRFLNNNTALLDALIQQINLWENRIVFIMGDSFFKADPDNNMVSLQLTYYVKKTQIKNTFKRKIRIR